jgi:hypothetical protein
MTIREQELLSQQIEQMARDIAESIRFSAQRKMQQKQLDLQSLQKVKDFMSLAPDKRKALLLDPHFRQTMMETLDPESFASVRKTKKATADVEGMKQRETSVLSLGEETSAEKLAREKAKGEAEKATAEGLLAQQKQRLSTGVEAATPMSLLIAGDVKDPVANALFSLIPQNELKNIALAEHKTGPLYQQTQQQEWYKWGVNEGLPPGLAMETAFRISKGEWDKVPTQYQDATTGKTVPVRGKAEQQLAMDAMNARSRAQEVQNTIQSSITTSSTQLAEKAGIPLDHSYANIMALRAGKPTPFPTPNLQEIVGLDLQNKSLEIQKNIQTILNDKSGIGMIKESLTALTAQYKQQQGYVWDSSKSKDLEDKINKLTEELSSRLSSRYGIKFDKYEEIHSFWPVVKGATSNVWDGMKATGAYGEDLGKAFSDTLKQPVEGARLPVPPSSRVGPNVGAPVQKHTPEQEAVLTNLYKSFQAALADDKTPVEQKNSIRKYIQDVLEPAYLDPLKFNNLFNAFQPQE